MQMTGAIQPTIGPYEVYEDGWFNYKAGFESFIAIQDDAESAKLQKYSSELQDIEDHLPIDAKYRNPKLGSLAPIVVVNEIFCSGDGNHGVQTAAFNLPNDERITKKGIETHPAQERAGREVREDAGSDFKSRAQRGGSERPGV